MANPIEISVDIYLVNSKVNEVSELRRKLGVVALWLARRLLKSELRVEEVRSNPPPLRYWQHEETGRVCATPLGLGEGWVEITQEQYRYFASTQSRAEGGPVSKDAFYIV